MCFLRTIVLFSCFFSLSYSAFALEDIDELMHFSSKQEDVLVVHVNAPDYVTLEDGRRIHLIGIESAGVVKPRNYTRDKNGMIIPEKEDAAISLEEQALTYAQNLLEGKKVKLEFDVDSRGLDGKKEAHVFLPDGKLASAELLRQGFVNLRIRPPNLKYADQLRDAYQEAKREQRGYLSN